MDRTTLRKVQTRLWAFQLWNTSSVTQLMKHYENKRIKSKLCRTSTKVKFGKAEGHKLVYGILYTLKHVTSHILWRQSWAILVEPVSSSWFWYNIWLIDDVVIQIRSNEFKKIRGQSTKNSFDLRNYGAKLAAELALYLKSRWLFDHHKT